jgi:hypothetical protein
MNDTAEKIKRPRAVKLYAVTDSNGQKVYVKAKTKSDALNYIVGKHFSVEVVSQNGMLDALDDITKGAVVEEVEEG